MQTRSSVGVYLAFFALVAFAAGCGEITDDPDGGKGACDPTTPELCNGKDDDCDEEIDEIFQPSAGTPGLGDPCDGADTDQCLEGTLVCDADGHGLACSDSTSNIAELCNGADEDCDGVNDNGFPVGEACDSEEDADLCLDDVFVCSTSALRVVCQNVTSDGVERCNGLDDDCDGTVDDGFGVGDWCDGPDADFCSENEGRVACNLDGTGTVCTDTTGDALEICDGNDNDCDGQIDEGFLPAPGTPCDGEGDSDLCVEGTFVCNPAGTATVCNDNTSSTVEYCNGLDDDCSGTPDDGEFRVGEACDGDDTDRCLEGTRQCIDPDTAVCDDRTSNDVETCNDVDDDCDGTIDNRVISGRHICCEIEVGNCEPEKGENATNCPEDCA